MSDAVTTPDVPAPPSDAERRALNRMVAFHISTAVVIAGGGFLAGSQALMADALDFLGIGSIAALALVGFGRDHAWRARAALVQAVFQGLLSFVIIIAALWRMTGERVPQPAVMALFAVGAFAANAAFAYLVLKDHGSITADAAAIWRQGRAQLIEDAAILVAALLVWISDAAWADCLVAAAIAAPLLRSSWAIMLDSRGTLEGANRRRRRVG